MPFSLTTEQKQSMLWIAVALALLMLLSLLGPVLMPFVVAAILAYVLNPWVDKLCARRFRKLHVPRAICVGSKDATPRLSRQTAFGVPQAIPGMQALEARGSPG